MAVGKDVLFPIQKELLREMQIKKMYAGLKNRAENTAEFDKEKPDYIVLQWANKEIDPVAEAQAAEIVVYKFLEGLKQSGVQIDFQKLIFLGIPNSGGSFANAVKKALQKALNIELPPENLMTLHKFQPGDVFPEKEKQDESYLTVPSPSAGGEDRTYQIPAIPTDCPIFVIDDVVATGNIGDGTIQKLKKAGNQVVGMGTFFTKLFMHGKEKIEDIDKESGVMQGVPVYSALDIEEIVEDAFGTKTIRVAPFSIPQVQDKKVNGGSYYWLDKIHPSYYIAEQRRLEKLNKSGAI